MLLRLSWASSQTRKNSLLDFKAEPIVQTYPVEPNVKDFFVDRDLNFLTLTRDETGCTLKEQKTLGVSDSQKTLPNSFAIPNSGSKICLFRDSGYGTYAVELENGELFIVKKTGETEELVMIPKIDYPKDRSQLNRVLLLQTQDLVYYLYLYKSYRPD